MNVQFDPAIDYTLEDNCVLLRPLQENDCKNLLLFSLNEPDLWKYSLVKVAGEENLKAYISTALTARQSGNEYPFIVLINVRRNLREVQDFMIYRFHRKHCNWGIPGMGRNFTDPG